MTLPIGQRFSLTYVERGTPERDTTRFRLRLREKFNQLIDGVEGANAFGSYLVAETGASVKQSGGYYWPDEIFNDGSMRDVLDTITCFYDFSNLLAAPYRGALSHATQKALAWRSHVERCLVEENMGYRLDEKCGVHYHVDAAFEASRIATIAVLAHPMFANARSNFEDACRHMDGDPRDTKAAVRSMFEAAEVLGKQLCPGVQQLRGRMIEDVMKPRVAALVASDPTEQAVWAGMLDGMVDWVNAMHNYRHGQPGPDPVAPSDELAVFIMSSGTTYVRALANWTLQAASNP